MLSCKIFKKNISNITLPNRVIGHFWHIHGKGDISISVWLLLEKIVPSNHPMQFVGLKHLTKFLPQHNLLLQLLDYEVLEVVYMLGAAHGSKKRSAGSFSSCTCRSKGAPPEFTDLKWISGKDFQGGLLGKQKNVLQYPFANKGLIFKGTEISCHKMEVRSEIIHFFPLEKSNLAKEKTLNFCTVKALSMRQKEFLFHGEKRLSSTFICGSYSNSPPLSLANHLHPHASKLMVQFAILDVFGTKSWPGVFFGGNGFFTSKMSQISPSHLHVAHQHGGTETMHATWEWQRLIPTAMLPRTRIYFPHPCTTNRNLSQVKGGWSLFKETTLGLETKTSMFFPDFYRVMLGWDSEREWWNDSSSWRKIETMVNK